jgi:hypothetical protein
MVLKYMLMDGHENGIKGSLKREERVQDLRRDIKHKRTGEGEKEKREEMYKDVGGKLSSFINL